MLTYFMSSWRVILRHVNIKQLDHVNISTFRGFIDASVLLWPLSFQVILFSDRNPIFDYISDFLHENTPSKWEQRAFIVILHDGLYIYRYTFSMVQYTFIGWVWEAPATHLYQIHGRDTPEDFAHPSVRNNTSIISIMKIDRTILKVGGCDLEMMLTIDITENFANNIDLSKNYMLFYTCSKFSDN